MKNQFLLVLKDYVSGEISHNFAEDILTYSKYLAVKDCPKNKLKDLEKIFTDGNGQEFADFCVREVPLFNERLQNYISQYDHT